MWLRNINNNTKPLSTLVVYLLLCSSLDLIQCMPSTVDDPVELLTVAIDSVYDRMFQANSSGWLGADAATSIVLDDRRTLWLFGDTFLGEIIDGRRVPNRHYTNSTIAIQDRTQDPRQSIRYYWRRQDGKDQSFFPYQEGTAGHYYWPTSAIMVGEHLLVFCMAVNLDWSEEWIAGTVVAIIDNPGDDPLEWQIRYIDLGLGDDSFVLHAALWLDVPYVYFLALDQLNNDPENRRMILARSEAEALIAGSSSDILEY